MSTRPNASSNANSVAFGLAALLVLFGCGNSDTSGSETCDSSYKCQTAGQECNPQSGFCETVCQQSQCAASSECSSYFGTCIPVSCGQFVPCQEAGSYCDQNVHECYPVSGKCRVLEDCPRPDARVGKVTNRSCKDGFCQLSSAQPADISGQTSRPLAVFSPSPGAQLSLSDPLRWDGNLGATSIALVLTALPPNLSQILTTAVWGRVLPADADPVVRWEDGVAIQNGVWLQSSAAVPSGPLYFVVQAVRRGQLLGISLPIPFRLNSAWPALGAHCTDNNVLPGSCTNPARPQICLGGVCRQLCASHVDCAADKKLCGTPNNGVRTCE